MKTKEIVQKLNNLIQEKDFQKLNSLLQTKFNLFHLLNIETKEIYYSKILGWLLNPQGNHKLGNVFLRNFLKMLISENERKHHFNKLRIEYVDIDCISLENVKVSIEQTVLSQKRLDIFVQIISSEDDENWILVIENKIRSTESPNQTKFYSDELSERYPETGIKKICVFLTPTGAKAPLSEEFMSSKWSEIRTLLIEILNETNISNEIKYFLNQFKNSIEVFVMENPDLEKLYLKLFQKYSDVFEFLFKKYSEYRSSPYFKYSAIVEMKLNDMLPDGWFLEKGKGWNIICKKDWIEIQERNNWGGKSKYSLITVIEAKIESGILKIYIYSQSKLSRKILKNYKKKVEDFIKNTKRKESIYDKYFVNFNPNQNALFNYTVIDNIEDFDNEEISGIAIEKLRDIIKEYETMFDEVIHELSF